MKIIATIHDDKFLCEITSDEIAQLYGLRDSSVVEYRKLNIQIGNEINLQKAIDILNDVRHLDQGKLAIIARHLQYALDQVETAKTTAEGLNLFDKLSKDIK